MSSTRAERERHWPGGSIAIAPSLLNCDFGYLSDEIADAERAGASIVHWDVMDGDFCPNFTYGPPVIKSLRPHTDLLFDVHLMVMEPAKYLPQFLDAGSDIVTFHIEADPQPAETIRAIKSAGARAGLALNPPTPVEAILPWLGEVDLVLVMSVMPGFGGQSFNPDVLSKVSVIKKLRSDVCVEIDGGINPETIGTAAEAGVSLFVVGSAFYNADNRPGVYQALRERATAGRSRAK